MLFLFVVRLECIARNLFVRSHSSIFLFFSRDWLDIPLDDFGLWLRSALLYNARECDASSWDARNPSRGSRCRSLVFIYESETCDEKSVPLNRLSSQRTDLE
jgi:hypothetical protein